MKTQIDLAKLNAAAADLGFSSHEIGRRTGIPQSTVIATLVGRSKPSAERLKEICDVLDLNINDVFTTAAPLRKAA